MTNKLRTRKLISLIVNVLLVIMEFIGLVLMVELYKSYNLHPFGWYKYYTQLSNIFSMFAALSVAVFTARDLIKNTDSIPNILRLLKFSSACCLTETLLVTMFVLAPMGMMGGFVPIMFEGPNLYHHFLCPLVSVLSLCILERGEKITLRHCALSMVPTLAYGVVAVILNLMKVWHGPYPFLYVYEQPVYMSIIWAVVILGGAFAITIMVKAFANLHLRVNHSAKRKEN